MKEKICPDCNGTSVDHLGEPCPTCDGYGILEQSCGNEKLSREELDFNQNEKD